jgi:uncharacterized protein
MQSSGGVHVINKKLLEILACPVCKGPVEEKEDWILCHACKKRYPVRDDIPIMLVDEAEDIPEE